MIKKSSRNKVSLKEALNRVGLSKEVKKKVYQLSGGEQQRVALARLMMTKCSVVLADEPTGSLDKKNRDIVMRLLHELKDVYKRQAVGYLLKCYKFHKQGFGEAWDKGMHEAFALLKSSRLGKRPFRLKDLPNYILMELWICLLYTSKRTLPAAG